MTMAGPVTQSACYVDGKGGPLFVLTSEPCDRPPRGTVVWAHAFAEEMNKSRRMSGRLARMLARVGWRVVQPDLFGCGDSAGELRDARWDLWIDDLASLLDRSNPSQPAWLWAVRAGALMAPALSESRPDVNLLLWQPVLNGATHLQQFLRLHAGARIVGSTKADAGATPAQRLRDGETVEVGGYELPPAVAGGMQAARFDLPAGFAGRIVWLEVSAQAEPVPSPQASSAVAALRARNLRVGLEAVAGPSFWQTQEIEDCDALLTRTLAQLDAAASA